MNIDNNSKNAGVSTVQKIDGAIPKSFNNVLKGITGKTWNGGIIQPISYKKIYAGTKIKNLNIKGQIRMLTPLVPLTTKLTTTVKAFFVPNSRIWKNALKFSAQKQQSQMITAEPNFNLSQITSLSGTPNITDTAEWRDCIASAYLPRIASGQDLSDPLIFAAVNQKVSVLPLRGYNAIVNDYYIHKELDKKLYESKEDTTTTTELKNYIPLYIATNTDYTTEQNSAADNNYSLKARGKKRNNYYTNWRTNLVGSKPTDYQTEGSTLQTHTEWAKTIAEMRENAENAQLNDWEIVAKIRGTKPALQGQVQQIGEKNIAHNYSQVAQTAYNEGTPNAEFQSLGTTGAYSFTEFSIDIINFEEIIEDGYIHILAQTTADTIFAGGIDRELININWDEQYRPELKELKDDTIKKAELTSVIDSIGGNPLYINIGFKRKYSEIFKMPIHIAGDLTKGGVKELASDNDIPSEQFWLCQEDNITAFNDVNNKSTQPKYWSDNTDLLINETMALKQDIVRTVGNNLVGHRILGKNQFKMIAETTMIANLPIDEAIKTDFKRTGEV